MKWLGVVAFLGWCLFIVGTSSTVIRPHDFFAWFAAHVFTDETSFRRFVVFWSYSWFIIVKGWHAAEFAILCWLGSAFLNRFASSTHRRGILISVIFCVSFALADEYHQTFIPGRGGTWTDVGIDCIGIFAAALAASGARPWRFRILGFRSRSEPRC
ncbi:MAG: VanZ family protein [Isosphaeraceae bacterium]